MEQCRYNMQAGNYLQNIFTLYSSNARVSLKSFAFLQWFFYLNKYTGKSRNPENDAAGAVAVAKDFGGPETHPQVSYNGKHNIWFYTLRLPLI